MTAVDHGRSGVLIDGHDPADYARACAALLERPEQLVPMRAAARAHAEGFGWRATAERTLEAYSETIGQRWATRRFVSSGLS